MIIESIQTKFSKNRVTLSSVVTFHGKKPRKMYFSTERKYASFVMSDATPFLAAVLIPCMKTGENIIVKGSISDKFMQNIWKIMNLLILWNPHLHAIALQADTIVKDCSTPQSEGTFFSAGVDSFYTYLKHQNTMSHFIFVDGFDIELENDSLFKKTLHNIKVVAKQENISVITVKTNIKNIIEPIYIWDWVHGGALGAVGLFLRNGFKQIYISSNVKKEELFPYGTHPELDYLWSTEHLHVTHFGTACNRHEKVLSIANSELALSYLHVCADNKKGVYNCGRCSKCLRTMIQLTAANVLHKAKTFPNTIDLSLVRERYPEISYNCQFDTAAVLKILKKENREPALIEALQDGIAKSKKGTSLKKRIIRAIAYFDQEYNQRRIYTFIFTMNHANDRNIFYKTFVNLGFIV